MFPQLVVWPIRPWLVQSFSYLRAASFGVWGLKVVLAWWEASTREKIKLHFSCPETIALVFDHTLWIWLAVSQIRGATTPVPHNMYLPLGMESHPGTLFLVMVPIQMGEVNSVQLRTSKLPPQTRQPHLLQRKNVQHHGNVFSQLVMKNMSDLQTFTVKELVRPVADPDGSKAEKEFPPKKGWIKDLTSSKCYFI